MMSSTLTIKVSIEDIVLPLPGHDVIYPNNQGQYVKVVYILPLVS